MSVRTRSSRAYLLHTTILFAAAMGVLPTAQQNIKLQNSLEIQKRNSHETTETNSRTL